jgi:hypothetical protein
MCADMLVHVRVCAAVRSSTDVQEQSTVRIRPSTVIVRISHQTVIDNSGFWSYNMCMVKEKLIDLIRRSMLDMERSVTLPDERYRALKWAEQLLQDLLDPKVTPRVPRTVRQQARAVLRHYPGSYYIEQLARRAPDIITPKMEEVHKFILQGQQQDN